MYITFFPYYILQKYNIIQYKGIASVLNVLCPLHFFIVGTILHCIISP